MNIKNIALEILTDVCEIDEWNENMELDLFDAGLIDSLATISIILLIEEKLGLQLQPTDFEKENISTVNNFSEFLIGKVKSYE